MQNIKYESIRLLIFDLDGTLVDSVNNITNSVNFVREKINHKSPIDIDRVIDFLNDDSNDKAKNLFGSSNETIEESRRAFVEYYLNHCTDNISFYEGIKEIIYTAHSKGVSLAIATNGSSIFAQKILKYLNSSDYFCAILGADMVTHSKPNPQMIYKAMQIADASKNQTIMIGDSSKDMQAALNAKCKAIYANWGYGKDSCGMPVATNPFEVMDILKWQ